LHPAGAREDLLVLLLAGGDDRARVVEDDRPGAGRALVDGEHVVRHGCPFTSRWTVAGLRRGSEQLRGGEAAEGATDEGAEDRDPGVAPVAADLAADRQDGVREARAEVTGGVDGVAGRAAEAVADADDEQRDREGTQA